MLKISRGSQKTAQKSPVKTEYDFEHLNTNINTSKDVTTSTMKIITAIAAYVIKNAIVYTICLLYLYE